MLEGSEKVRWRGKEGRVVKLELGGLDPKHAVNKRNSTEWREVWEKSGMGGG